MIVQYKRTKLSLSKLAICTPLLSILHFCQHVVNERYSIIPFDPLNLPRTGREPVTVGQMAMVTSHGGRHITHTSGAKSWINGRPLGPMERHGTRVCVGNAVLGEVQRVGDMGRSASKGATKVFSGCCSKYCP